VQPEEPSKFASEHLAFPSHIEEGSESDLLPDSVASLHLHQSPR
jgi:hypothetical protein